MNFTHFYSCAERCICFYFCNKGCILIWVLQFPAVSTFTLSCVDRDLRWPDKWVHCFSHIPQTPSFVHIVSFAHRQSTTKWAHVCFSDSFTIVYNIKTLCTLRNESNFNGHGFAFISRILNQLDDPNLKLWIKILNFNIRRKYRIVVLQHFLLQWLRFEFMSWGLVIVCVGILIFVLSIVHRLVRTLFLSALFRVFLLEELLCFQRFPVVIPVLRSFVLGALVTIEESRILVVVHLFTVLEARVGAFVNSV